MLRLTNLTTRAFCKGDTRPKDEGKFELWMTHRSHTANDSLQWSAQLKRLRNVTYLAHDRQLQEDLGAVLLESERETLAVCLRQLASMSW